MTLDLLSELWEYHYWANRRLFELSAALGEDTASRELGAHFSAPTLRGMLTHVYGADRFWLDRWQGRPAPSLSPDDVYYGWLPATLAELRPRWDALEAEQRAYLGALDDADLARTIEGRSRFGGTFTRRLGMLLVHVPNHATHHRSELSTMLTLLGAPPPDTGVNAWLATRPL